MYRYKLFIGKAEGKRTVVKPKCSQRNNIDMVLRGIGYEDVN
jgi:hypothetical protein